MRLQKRTWLGILALLMVCMLIPSVNAEAKKNKLTKQEKKNYQRMLKTKDYTGCGIYSGDSLTTFVLYDVNGDGHNELIVSGMLGLRSATFSRMYSHVNGKLVHYDFAGTFAGVSKKGMRFVQNDYGDAGRIRYYEEYVYTFSKSGVLTKKASSRITTEYNMMGKKQREITTEDFCTKFVNNVETEITRKDYNKLVKKYKFNSVGEKKKVKNYKVTTSNIRKYVK